MSNAKMCLKRIKEETKLHVEWFGPNSLIFRNQVVLSVFDFQFLLSLAESALKEGEKADELPNTEEGT